MIPNELLILSSPEFEAKIVASTPSVLRLLLARTTEVQELRKAFDAGEISSEQIQKYVEGLLRKHASREVFPHQTALAAIAVVFETRFAPLARDYLRDLARLTAARYWIAGRVGQICTQRQSQCAQTSARKFPIARAPTEIVFLDLTSYRACSDRVTLSHDQFEVSDAKP